jgi:hypothetical protein
MHNPVTRRVVLQGAIAGAVAAVAGLSGCGDAGHSKSAPRAGPESLIFDDSQDFYQRLVDSLNGGKPVDVLFDRVKVTRDSRLIEFLGKAGNSRKLWERIRDSDTEEGRAALRTALAPELLEREAVNLGQAKASNNVVDPGTILLVAVILLILSAGTVGTIEALKRPVTVKLELGFEPPLFNLTFIPGDPA